MMPMITTEERTLRDYVSPFLCHELLTYGLEVKNSRCMYMVGDNSIFLRDYAWDHAGFYKETDKGFFEACGQPVRNTLPAFSIGDMSLLLPPYMLTKNNEQDWEITLDNWYDNVDIQRDRRAPDVLARMVLALLKKRILTPDMCNHQLS